MQRDTLYLVGDESIVDKHVSLHGPGARCLVADVVLTDRRVVTVISTVDGLRWIGVSD